MTKKQQSALLNRSKDSSIWANNSPPIPKHPPKDVKVTIPIEIPGLIVVVFVLWIAAVIIFL